MSVPVQNPINQIIIAGGEALIPWTWNLQKESEITVLVLRASTGLIDTLTLTVDYTVDANGLDNDNGGNITPVGSEFPVTAGDIWTLFRVTVIDRSTDFSAGGAFFASTINEQLDELTRINQETNRDVADVVRKDPGVGDSLNPLIPQPVDERSLKFRDTGGGNFELVMSDGNPDEQTNEAAASAAAALASEQAAALSAVNAETAEGNAETAQANAETAETNAETAQANAETAETNAETAETNAETAETNAETAETNASNSETAAGISETNAETSATAASDQLEGTSTTSVLIETGPTLFVTQANKFFEAGVSLKIISDADPANFMFGAVTSYAGTALAINIRSVEGSGTFADWTIRLSGVEGAEGPEGPEGPEFFGSQLIHVQDQKSTGTEGGDFISSAERTRLLNTVLINEIAGASLAMNQITLPAGNYYIEASAPALSVLSHRAILRDITGASDLLVGTASFSLNDIDYAQDRSIISGRFILSTESDLEIRHNATASSVVSGFGMANGLGPHEVYTDVKIWRVS